MTDFSELPDLPEVGIDIADTARIWGELVALADRGIRSDPAEALLELLERVDALDDDDARHLLFCLAIRAAA